MRNDGDVCVQDFDQDCDRNTNIKKIGKWILYNFWMKWHFGIYDKKLDMTLKNHLIQDYSNFLLDSLLKLDEY